ncbi:MAG TPA: ATP phosphoribosyltransferase, partial [Firmicutes bacterium]|nr:ATP phosphoribosyltransferase [Bacillota bacterium]
MLTLTLALPKGRLFEPTVALLRASGIDGFQGRILEVTGKARGMAGNLSIVMFLIRDDDVPTYVSRGAADMGIVGKDVLDESGEEVVELLDLGLGCCRLSLAAPAHLKEVSPRTIRRVATKYPAI